MIGIAMGVLVAGSLLCLSLWVPTDLNVTIGPGTATYVALILWTFVLLIVLLFVTISLRTARLMWCIPVAVLCSALSWGLLALIGSSSSSVVLSFFVVLNIVAAGGAWYVVRYVQRQ